MEIDDLEPDKMEDFFLEDALEEMVVHEALDLLLLVIEEKPGASVTLYFQAISSDFRSFIEKFSHEFNLAYLTREVEGEKERGENVTGSKVFFAKKAARLDMIKPFKDATTRDIGLFLGYPEKAVEEFETSRGFRQTYNKFEEMMADESVNEEEALDFLEKNTSDKSYAERFDEKVREMIEGEVLEEGEKKYLELVSYIPCIEEEEILEAVEEGKRRKEILRQMDEELGVEVGEKYLEKIL